jgi:hypothetical protein
VSGYPCSYRMHASQKYLSIVARALCVRNLEYLVYQLEQSDTEATDALPSLDLFERA